MTKKPSRLEKAAEKHWHRVSDITGHDDFKAGARWCYRALLREIRVSGFVEHPIMRRAWERISKAGK